MIANVNRSTCTLPVRHPRFIQPPAQRHPMRPCDPELRRHPGRQRHPERPCHPKRLCHPKRPCHPERSEGSAFLFLRRRAHPFLERTGFFASPFKAQGKLRMTERFQNNRESMRCRGTHGRPGNAWKAGKGTGGRGTHGQSRRARPLSFPQFLAGIQNLLPLLLRWIPANRRRE